MLSEDEELPDQEEEELLPCTVFVGSGLASCAPFELRRKWKSRSQRPVDAILVRLQNNRAHAMVLVKAKACPTSCSNSRTHAALLQARPRGGQLSEAEDTGLCCLFCFCLC